MKIARRRREEEIVLGSEIDEAETAKTAIVIRSDGFHGDGSGRSAEEMMICRNRIERFQKSKAEREGREVLEREKEGSDIVLFFYLFV